MHTINAHTQDPYTNYENFLKDPRSRFIMPLLDEDCISPEGSTYHDYCFVLSYKVCISCYKIIAILLTCVCSGRYRGTSGNPLKLYTSTLFRCLLINYDIVTVLPGLGFLCMCLGGGVVDRDREESRKKVAEHDLNQK